jgi:hypothetical protein
VIAGIAASALAACATDSETATTSPATSEQPRPTPSTTAADTGTVSSSSVPPTTKASTTTVADDAGCATGSDGRILAVADADMVATAYTDGVLGEPQPGVVDSLTVIEPAASGLAEIVTTLDAPNAVTGPVWVFDTSPDHRYAYVIETTQPNDAGLTRFSELYLRPGNTLTTIDLCTPDGPTVIASVDTALGPTTVSASPDGQWLAVAHRADIRLVAGVDPASVDVNDLAPGQFETGAQAGLVLHAIADGEVRAATPVQLPAELLGSTDEVTYAGWSPEGQTLAVAVRSTRKLGFFRIDPTGTLAPWGNLVDIDEGTFGGTWSPDGRHFYVNNIRGAARPASQAPTDFADYLGSLQTVRLADPAAPELVHKVVQTEPTPIFPEGVAVSPDGTLVATVNMQTSALPVTNPLHSPQSTISLWTRDPATGQLTKASDTPFRGILPEGTDFDPTSSRLAVAVYHDADDRSIGYVDLWSVQRDANGFPTLVADQRLETSRGTHHLMWIP